MQATVVEGGVSIRLTGEPSHFADLLRELHGSDGKAQSGLGLQQVLDVQLRQPEPQGLQEVWRAQDEGGRATGESRGGWGCRRCGGRAGRLELCRVCQVELWPLQLVQEVRHMEGTEGATVGSGSVIGAGQAGGAGEVTFPSGHSSQTDGSSVQAIREKLSIPSGRQQG